MFGNTPAGTERASIQVTVTGVDVRLDVRRPSQETTVVVLAPDEAIHLASLLQRAVET